MKWRKRFHQWKVKRFVYDFRVSRPPTVARPVVGCEFFQFQQHNRMNKIETIDVCWPISVSTDGNRCYYPHITRCDRWNRYDFSPTFLLLYSAFGSDRSVYGCCANLWDHRENDFASFSIGFFNHRSYHRNALAWAYAKTKLMCVRSVECEVECWQAATERTIKW